MKLSVPMIAKSVLFMALLLQISPGNAQAERFGVIYRNDAGFYFGDLNSSVPELVYEDATIMEHFFSKSGTKIIFQNEEGIFGVDVNKWEPNLIMPLDTALIEVFWHPNEKVALITVFTPPKDTSDGSLHEEDFIYHWESKTIEQWDGGNCNNLERSVENTELLLLCKNTENQAQLGINWNGDQETLIGGDYEPLFSGFGKVFYPDWGRVGEQDHLVFTSIDDEYNRSIYVWTAAHSTNLVSDRYDLTYDFVSVSPARDLVSYFIPCEGTPVGNCIHVTQIADGTPVWQSDVSIAFPDYLFWSLDGSYIVAGGYKQLPGSYEVLIFQWSDNNANRIEFELPQDVTGSIAFGIIGNSE